MWDIEITIAVSATILLIFALALKGDAVVWNIPPYRKFKGLVHELEQATVTHVKGSKNPHELTLKKVGRRRVPEVFQTPVAMADSVTIGECFGAIFLKDESIDETISGVIFNAWVVILVSLGGAVFVLTQDRQLGDAIQNAGFWQRIPLLATAMFEDHFVLLAELVAILSGLFYLLHNTRLVRRLIRSFDKG